MQFWPSDKSSAYSPSLDRRLSTGSYDVRSSTLSSFEIDGYSNLNSHAGVCCSSAGRVNTSSSVSGNGDSPTASKILVETWRLRDAVEGVTTCPTITEGSVSWIPWRARLMFWMPQISSSCCCCYCCCCCSNTWMRYWSSPIIRVPPLHAIRDPNVLTRGSLPPALMALKLYGSFVYILSRGAVVASNSSNLPPHSCHPV